MFDLSPSAPEPAVSVGSEIADLATAFCRLIESSGVPDIPWLAQVADLLPRMHAAVLSPDPGYGLDEEHLVLAPDLDARFELFTHLRDLLGDRDGYLLEFDRTGDNEASVAWGLARTGRLITNAAALLVVVVGAFITSDILFMKTLGVGMALAVGLDATVIRALLVPATMRMMGEWNWWAPAQLKRLWQKAGLGDGH
jgi:hypothetical protein